MFLIVGVRLLFRQDIVSNIWLVGGWIIGYILAGADHLLYAVVCNPQELTCQKIKQHIARSAWHEAWKVLKETEHERTRLPISNMLTGLIVAVLGVWVVTSSGSLLASGVVVGLEIKLYTDFILDSDKKKWYWMFAKEVEILGMIWGLLLLIQLISLVR